MAKVDRTYCCVPQCKSQGTKNPDLSFHKFPAETSKVQVKLLNGDKVLVPRKTEWLRILKIGKKVSDRSKVCSKHFGPGDYIMHADGTHRGRLRPTALPSHFLPIVPRNLNKDSKTKQCIDKEALLEKLNREEKAEEFTTGTVSQKTFYSEIKEVLGDFVNLNGCLKDTSTRCEEMPVEESTTAESGSVTILRLTPKEVNEDGELFYIDEDHEKEDSNDVCFEREESKLCNETSSNPCLSSKSNTGKKKVDSKLVEKLQDKYKEAKQSLTDTDKKLIELLSSQNDLIRTQNELCRMQNELCKTQNSLLTAILEKM